MATIHEWIPLSEMLARAGSPERLIRRCQEIFTIAHFAYIKYLNQEGQPDRDDTTIAWGWWSLRNIHVTPDYIDFGRGRKAFRVFGVEILKPHADKLFPKRSEQPAEPPAAEPPDPPETLSEPPISGRLPASPKHAGGRDPEHDWESAAGHVDGWVANDGLSPRPLPRHKNGKPVIERAVELMIDWFQANQPPPPEPGSVRRWIRRNPHPGWWGSNEPN
jgi:hypothetical protein